MDPDTGVFNAPMGGSYLFVFHIATHDNKKALLSIRLNGEEVASVFDQNHKVFSRFFFFIIVLVCAFTGHTI